MKTRVKTAMPPVGVVSIIFSILGFVYLLLGVLCTYFPEDADDKSAGIVIACIGIALLLVSLICLLVLIFKQQKKNKARSGGKYLDGEVVDIVPCGYFHYGYRPTFTVLTRYIDQKGTIHIFRTNNLKTYPDRSIVGRKVKIYYTDESFQQYYVDLDSGFPKVIEH